MGFFDSLFGKKNNKSSDSNVYVQRQSVPAPVKAITREQKLVLLKYAENTKVGENHYPAYLNSKFGISSPKSGYDELLRDGFIRMSTNKEALPHLKNNELKDIASGNGLSTGGKKDDLCKRIIDEVSEESLDKLNIPRYWILTEKGKEELNNNPFVSLFTDKHKYDLDYIGIKYADVASSLADKPVARVRDLLWGRFVKMSFNASVESFQTKNFHDYCDMLRLMALFLEEEGKYVDALSTYLRYLYYQNNFKAVISARAMYGIDKSMKRAIESFMLDAELLPFQEAELTDLIKECEYDQQAFNEFMIFTFQRER